MVKQLLTVDSIDNIPDGTHYSRVSWTVGLVHQLLESSSIILFVNRNAFKRPYQHVDGQWIFKWKQRLQFTPSRPNLPTVTVTFNVYTTDSWDNYAYKETNNFYGQYDNILENPGSDSSRETLDLYVDRADIPKDMVLENITETDGVSSAADLAEKQRQLFIDALNGNPNMTKCYGHINPIEDITPNQTQWLMGVYTEKERQKKEQQKKGVGV